MQRPLRAAWLWLACLAFSWTLSAQSTGKPDHHYIPGFRTPRQLGVALTQKLSAQQREWLAADPVVVQPDDKPYVLARTVADPAEPKPRGVVYISMGFIDLVNNLAHAKAIDKIQKGYFEKYVLSLAQEEGEAGLKELPGITDDKYWNEDIMNEQVTYFSQMAGLCIGVKLAHHYLGQYQKYAPKMFEGGDPASRQTVRISNLLTADEWAAAMKAGARNALDAVAGVDGMQMLLEAMEKMPKRPEWASCFVPDKDLVKLSKLRKDLKKGEEDFFNMK